MGENETTNGSPFLHMSHFQADALRGYEEGLKFDKPQPKYKERGREEYRRDRERREGGWKGVLYISKRSVTFGSRV